MADILIRCLVPGLPACVLMRHGETPDTVAGLISGWRDVPLTVEGRRQAAGVAFALVALGIRRVVSSDLRRAVETASIVTRELGLAAPRQDRRLRERGWGVREGRPRRHERGRGDEAAPAGGESLAEASRRVMEGLVAVPPRSLVVTHAGPIREVLALAGVADAAIAPCGLVAVNAEIAGGGRGNPNEYPMVAHVATPGVFAGRVVYVGAAEDVARVDAESLVILTRCPKAAAIDAMDRAAATVNLTRALTAHLTHGRMSPKPYAVAFSWPEGCPADGEWVVITPAPPPPRRERDNFPDVPPVPVADAGTVGGKAAGLELLRSIGANVPPFHVVSAPALDAWCRSGRLVEETRRWIEEAGLDPGVRWAVRSSADVEDGDETPMSGTFESRVRVRRDDIPGAIEEVLASAAGPEVMARIAAGEIAAPPRMAVVVQRMIEEPLIAGAIFVPAPDDPAEMLLEGRVGAGGELLMDGTAGPDVSARFDTAGRLLKLEGDAAPEIDEDSLRRHALRLAAEAADIHARTGRGDLEYSIDHAGTIWWLQARALPAAVEIVDRRGFAPAAQAYYRALAFRVHEANLTPPAWFRCVDLADGRFGYTSGIRRRDRLFHERIAANPEHLDAVTRFGWRVDEEFLRTAGDLVGRDPGDVLDLLILHSAVQLPFSMPLAGVGMDRFQSEPVDGHGGSGMIERFLAEVLAAAGRSETVAEVLALLRHPLRTSSVLESIRARRLVCLAGGRVDDDMIDLLAGLDIRDVPNAADADPECLRRRLMADAEADRRRGIDADHHEARLREQSAAMHRAVARRDTLLAELTEALPADAGRQLRLWADYLNMKAETNETHALHRGRCFIWFGRLGFRPDPRDRARCRPG